MSTPPPYFVAIWLACKACGGKWDDWQPQGCPIATWVAHIKTYRCPHCGKRGRNIFIRLKPLDPPGQSEAGFEP